MGIMWGWWGKSTAEFRILLHLPDSIEYCESDNMEGWLVHQDFGRYVGDFASDAVGLAVDGERLVHLFTTNQLDHIEWMIWILSVENEKNSYCMYQLLRISRFDNHGTTLSSGRRRLHRRWIHSVDFFQSQ